MPRRPHVPRSPSNSAFYLFSSLVLLISILCFPTMAETSTPQSGDSSADKAAVHIVYTERPKDNEDSEAFHIRTLASVLGRYALVWSVCFSLKLGVSFNSRIFLIEFCIILCVVRMLRRRLFFIVTRRLPVDSPLSSLLSRWNRCQVRLLLILISIYLFAFDFVRLQTPPPSFFLPFNFGRFDTWSDVYFFGPWFFIFRF